MKMAAEIVDKIVSM